jgi:hypothetical protein
VSEFERKILEELQSLRAEITALRSNYSILQSTYFENLAPDAVVGADYVAHRFGCSEAAVVRGRFDTDKIPRFRQKPLAFIKREVDAVFKALTRSPSERAAEIRYKAKKSKQIRSKKKDEI